MLLKPLFGVDYEVDGYLSPFFSPLIGQGILPAWFSPAILILWIPLGFRTTCYYYRKAYYRSYFADPPACAVGEPPSTGATRWRRRSRSSSRTSIGCSCTSRSCRSSSCGSTPSVAHFEGHWRLGLGNVVLFVNVVLLTGYSLSCHSLRHLVGGWLDCFSCSRRTRVRYTLWQRLTASTVTTCAGRGPACSRWRSPTCTSGPWRCGVFNDPAIRF